MSSDIYIDMRDVLTQPHLFGLSLAYNVSIVDATEEAMKTDVDWDWLDECLKPVRMVKFRGWKYDRPYDIVGNDGQPRTMHLSVGGTFRRWLMTWLIDHQVRYTVA